MKMNNKFDDIYLRILKIISNSPLEENKRTGVKTKSIWGYSFRWDMNYYPLLDCRQMYLKTGAAELAWMLQGTKDISFMKKYSKIWDKFTDDENLNEIKTAYGYRWRHAFGTDQVENILNKLKTDPSSRQQVLMSWDPRVDNVVPAKNIPCPFTAVIGIVGGKLNVHLSVRSNDCVIGLPYDALVYTLLGNAFANELKVPVGDLFYSIANAHIYESHLTTIDPLLAKHDAIYGTPYKINLKHSVSDIMKDPDFYVELIANDAKYSGYTQDKENMRFEIVK